MAYRFLPLLSFIALLVYFPGCEKSAPAARGGKHYLNLYPGETEELVKSLEREADHIISDIEGPLRDEIGRYMVYQVHQIGPLVYSTQKFAESQIKKAGELPDIIARHLVYEVREKTDQLVEEIEKYGNRHTKEELPQLKEQFNRYMAYHKEKVDEFVASVRRYDAVNRELLTDLKFDVRNFFRWQKENAKEIPDATRRYMEKVSRDYEEVMNTTGRMFTYNLSTKPELLADSLKRYAYHNTEEMLADLGKSTGRYFWENVQVNDLVKEMHCFSEHNIKKTADLVDEVQRYFSFNAEQSGMLSDELFRFLEWRTNQWVDLKSSLDRYITVNVEHYQQLKESPIRYLQHQQEEFEELKKIVPNYFLYNISKAEGLGLALKRYFNSQLGE